VSLEGLAGLRRALGLPATAVSWGVLDQVGMVARDAATGAHLRSVGLMAMDPTAALDALGVALADRRTAVGLVDIDWTTWARAHSQSAWNRLVEVCDADAAAAEGLVGELAALPEAERLDHAVGVLAAAAAPVFGLDPERLDVGAPLRDLGLDSLMAVELAGALARAASVEVSAMDLLGGRSVLALAQRVLAEASDAPVERPAATVGPPVDRLRDHVLLTAPYDILQDLRLDGDTLWAEVCPDVLPGEGVPVAAAEAGRHLAILGSLAAVRLNPDPARHEYAVHEADLVLEDVDGPPAERVQLWARCTSFDRSAGRATAEGALLDLDGRRLATLTVTYHVLPVTTLRALFPDHVRELSEAPADPYATWTPAPVLERGEGRAVTGLSAVPAASCAGHFPGLPALPVSILGREVFAAVREAAGHDVRVLRARLQTSRWVWADEPVRFVATADGSCEVLAAGEPAARFALQCAPMRATAHRRASRASGADDSEGSTVRHPPLERACA
jgi:acyl carrier protein